MNYANNERKKKNPPQKKSIIFYSKCCFMTDFWNNGILYYDIGNNELRVGTGNNSGRSPNALKSKNEAPTNLIIPSYINEKTITIIGRNAFSSCPNIRTVKIGRTINKIGEYAFEYCTSLQKFTIQGPSIVIMSSYSLAASGANKFTVYFGGVKHQTYDIFYLVTVTPTIIVSKLYKYETFGQKNVSSYSYKIIDNTTYYYQRTKLFRIISILITLLVSV